MKSIQVATLEDENDICKILDGSKEKKASEEMVESVKQLQQAKRLMKGDHPELARGGEAGSSTKESSLLAGTICHEKKRLDQVQWKKIVSASALRWSIFTILKT